MSTRILSRDRGSVVTCNACHATSMTGQVRKRDRLAHLRSNGWGRGSDPGQPHRPARPAIEAVRGDDGKVIERARRALPEIEGRPRTTGWDLCPMCLKKDREATAARKAAAAAAERRKARDAKRVASEVA